MSISVGKLATGNCELLQFLSFKEVMELHPLINTQNLEYFDAKKTKPIKARPVNAILKSTGEKVFNKLSLSTLEGNQPLKADSFICCGEMGDMWQQTADKIHAKYMITSLDHDGWATYLPKDSEDAIVNAFQVTDNGVGEFGGFSIINPWWGEPHIVKVDFLKKLGIDLKTCVGDPKDINEENAKIYLHYGVAGDFIVQNKSDKMDTYRVAKDFFNATYQTI